MTRKLILGIFLALFLLLTNLALAGEKSSPGPAITKLGAAQSDCGCLKKDKAPTAPRLRPDVLILRTVDQRCQWVCGWWCCNGQCACTWECVCLPLNPRHNQHQ